MIDDALKFVVNELNKYVVRKIDPQDDPSVSKLIVLGNVAKAYENDPGANNNPLLGKGIVSLVSIEEDRVSRSQKNYVKVNDKIEYRNPEVYLNMYCLFSVNHSTYETGLQYLSLIIQFFQYNNVLDPRTMVSEVKLDPKIDKLIFDMVSLNFEQVNHLWGILGGKYLPSALYKVRLVGIEDDTPQMRGGPITEIAINDFAN